jgi:hypothetical protein
VYQKEEYWKVPKLSEGGSTFSSSISTLAFYPFPTPPIFDLENQLTLLIDVFSFLH